MSDEPVSDNSNEPVSDKSKERKGMLHSALDVVLEKVGSDYFMLCPHECSNCHAPVTVYEHFIFWPQKPKDSCSVEVECFTPACVVKVNVRASLDGCASTVAGGILVAEERHKYLLSKGECRQNWGSENIVNEEGAFHKKSLRVKIKDSQELEFLLRDVKQAMTDITTNGVHY